MASLTGNWFENRKWVIVLGESRKPPSTSSALDRTPTEQVYRWFPGWTMLGFSAAAQYMSGPGQSYSVAAFKVSMIQGLAISETQFSMAYGVATLISGMLLPVVGKLLDVHGARRVLPCIAALLGAGCLMMSTVQSLAGLYMAFALIRSLGQGALTLAATWMVGEWFERRRGLATSLSGLGGSLSVMTFPLINLWLVKQYGWETGWAVLGLSVWVILVVPGILLIRNRPEDLGLLPDGRPNQQETGAAQVVGSGEREAPDGDWTWREAMSTSAFWKLVAVPATSALIGTGLIFHQVSILATCGISEERSLGLISLQAGVGLACIPVAGYLTDRIDNRYLLSAAMGLVGLATLLLLSEPSPWLVVLYSSLLGMHGSIIRSTASVVWLTYFGRAHQGTVRGVAFSLMILAAALGPLPLAISQDEFGSYAPALWLFLCLPAIALWLVCSARKPKKKGSSGTELPVGTPKGI